MKCYWQIRDRCIMAAERHRALVRWDECYNSLRMAQRWGSRSRVADCLERCRLNRMIAAGQAHRVII